MYGESCESNTKQSWFIFLIIFLSIQKFIFQINNIIFQRLYINSLIKKYQSKFEKKNYNHRN